MASPGQSRSPGEGDVYVEVLHPAGGLDRPGPGWDPVEHENDRLIGYSRMVPPESVAECLDGLDAAIRGYSPVRVADEAVMKLERVDF